ncbi:hypothetical protein RO3G_05479 [Rhizopus delemar RA 99-880]|uniref:LIM zinc-binding domain-containing protein n=1 Tax=Rhizopus delemar (strain RA 99-880 / ATCC MYA-4621 / FGSC 9543 / NRRL 43880) TaxID=246409 RepID=I1BX44_RHIO9|nr:hypothetical protein RO3G_05479 [Rhizopus delemar RA 99-880]|eukprot:EIE80774.1 hypothetical protein RO3G_05479 [Rhizopus delemar RA 99-880]
MAPKFGGAPKCPRCEKSVYMAEQVLGPGGPWHNYCLTCKECNKRLDSTTLTEKENEAYCKVCYNRKWGPKGYGFASGAAFLSTESKLPSEILQEQQLSPKPSLPPRPAQPVIPPKPDIGPQIEKTNEENMTSFWSKPSSGGYTRNHTSYVPRKLNFSSQSDICTGCKKPVYAAELALGAGNKYHKACLKCCQCSKRLDSTNMVDRDFDLYCRGCYSKAFGPKGYGYGNLLTPEGTTR